MTHQTDHIDDELLSAFVDDQLTPDEKALVQQHLASCSACQARLEELRSVIALIRELPELELPRDFALGPRLLVDPPNVIRLRRVYSVARTAAASLAAVFVLLSVGALYVDTRPGSATVTELAQPKAASAPAAADSQAATPAVRSAAPAAANQSAPAPASQPAPTDPDHRATKCEWASRSPGDRSEAQPSLCLRPWQ